MAASRPAPRNRILALAAFLLVVTAAGWWSSHRESRAGEGGYRTATVERGDIRVAISATGTLSAINTIDVGSQISGLVTDVLVDFNDRVTEGQGNADFARKTQLARQQLIARGNLDLARGRRTSMHAALRVCMRDRCAIFLRSEKPESGISLDG